MDEYVVNFKLVGLEKVVNSDIKGLYGNLMNVYSEEEDIIVASRWYDDELSFDVYKGDKKRLLLRDNVSSVNGTDELAAVARFVKNFNNLETDLIIGEVILIDNTFSFGIHY